ncbi:protein-glutamate methylesterase/protein-glutamine glutaminase [Algicella marina]|uniref:Protein-glutamate methylesterase/protein-glutamine glutaminase n=1 Tax=Algicella marina TaxID=2683284 RepID=A0A6P1T2E6_9RHOB|nr:chemotaxis response regulator protein-glutamate methylesterase [Algicella marina]QHQ36888.1 chemotaxis-specific protein-glutamate methyltransferase CheB [Algicella marina]
MTFTATGTRTRVVVVDDSSLMLKMITASLEAEGDIDVVGQARNPQEAREIIKRTDPDVVTLDVEMPGMNGLEFLEKIMSLRPMPVIMVSTLTKAGTDVTLSALHIGAVDAVAKPAGREGLAIFGNELRVKVRNSRGARVRKWVPAQGRATGSTNVGGRGGAAPLSRISGVDLIAIGSSTGGVAALFDVVAGLPPNGPPIVITQHMPARFTGRFAARLGQQYAFDVKEAEHGEPIHAGQIRVAPGDRHLCIQRENGRIVTRLDGNSGPISGHIPSVDVLFNSVCSAIGASSIGLILTGMGRDGAAGLRAMRNAGAFTIGQNESSCVVYGMPKAAAALNALDEELDLSQIGPRVCQFLNSPGARKRA